MAAGTGGLVLIGVLVTAMVMRRDASKRQQAGNVTTSGQAPSDVSPPRDTTRYAARTDSAPAGNQGVVDRGAVARASAVNVSARLDSLEKVVEADDATPAQADGVLRELQHMRGRIHGNEQIVQAGIVEAYAQSTRHHQVEACSALRRIEPAARTTPRARFVATAISAVPCP